MVKTTYRKLKHIHMIGIGGTGMNGIAPDGMKVKEGRVKHYGDGVDGKGEFVVAGFKRSMFEK